MAYQPLYAWYSSSSLPFNSCRSTGRQRYSSTQPDLVPCSSLRSSSVSCFPAPSQLSSSMCSLVFLYLDNLMPGIQYTIQFFFNNCSSIMHNAYPQTLMIFIVTWSSNAKVKRPLKSADVNQFLPAWRYASAGNSDRNVSVRLSVTRRYCVKTKKASIMISSPSGSPKTLVVFWRQISSPNSKGFSKRGPQRRVW